MADVTSINQIVITAKDDTGGAFASVRQGLKNVEASVVGLIDKASGLGPALTAITAAFGAGAFGTAIASAIEFQAHLAKLAETTGATVEALSAMRTAAKYSGTDMDQLSVALARFASNVVAAQAGTGKQAAALQALGFNAQTFAKQFATTDQALLAVAQRLNQYADGLGKTAIEQDLLGKSGAQFAAFLRELAERGTDSVKVTTEQALAARQLEDSITKLKSSFTDLVNRLATTLVPVLQKVVDGMDTFKTIAIAAIGAFVVWPATLTAATATVIAFREAIALTTIYNNLFGVSLQNIYAALGGIRLPAELAAGGLAALRASALLLFAAFAGWEIGKFLSDNFLQAKLAGYAFVDSMLTAWENVKYAGQVAWAFLQFAFEQAIESMRQSFGSFIAWVAQGLSHIPGAAGIAEAVQGFAATVAGPTGQALADFNAKLAQLGKANTDAKAKIHDITTDLMAYAIAADAGGAASARAAKAPPPVPAAAAQAVRDLTAAIDAYLKSEAALQKAFIDATAARLLQANEEQQADLKRSYDRGLVDFEAYWNKLTALQQQAIGVQIVQTQSEIANQQALVAQLQDSATKAAAVLNGLTPGTKAYADAQAAALKVQTDLDNANAKLITSTGKLNGLQEKGTQIGKDYVEQWNAAHNVIAASVSEINKQIEAQTFANQTIGLAASQVALLKAAELQEALALEIAGQNRAAQVKNLEDQIAAQQRLSAALKQGEDTQALLDSIRSIDQEAQRVWEDLFNGGHDAFKRLGDDIKKYLIDLLYQLTIKPLIVNIAANVLGVNQAQAAGAAGLGSNPILNLLGGNGGSTLLSRGVNSFVTSDVGATMGLSTAVPNAAVGSAESSLFGAAAGTSNVATGLGSLLTSVAPYIPFVAAAIPLLGSLFSHDPSQVHARFNITPTGTGAGTNEGGAGGTVASPYGDLGFNDQDTMYFSGSAGTALSNIVLGALQAFHPRLSTEQNQRLTQTLQSTNFGTFEGSYTTEDFIKQYGGDILKKVVVAAFHELDPALESVAANFTGTADDIAKFANSLLAIHDATQAIGNEDFTKNVDAALQGADQAMADKVLAFVTIVQSLGTPLDGLREKMLALDPANITKFVDALGGAQQALQGMAFINANFTTSADRAAAAQTNLDKSWNAAGITADDLANANLTTFPQTHEQFLRFLDSLDLNTQHGRDLAAMLINNVAPAFVAVQGSADAAAQALLQQAQAGRDYYTQHFLTPEEQTQQRIALDETSLYEATKSGTLLNKVLHDMGYDVIPSTVEGVRQWHDAVIAKYGADSEEAHAMEATIPIIGDLIDATGGFGDAAQQAAQQVNDAIGTLTVSVGSVIEQAVGAANDVLSNIGNLVDADTGDFGAKLAEKIALINTAIKNAIPQAFPNGTAYEAYVNTLKGSVADYTTQLGEFNRLTQTYDASIAEQLIGLEQWRNQQREIFKGMPEDLATIDAIFARKWDAIVSGTQTAVTAVQQSIEDFIKSLDSLVDQSHGNAGQRLSIEAAAGFSKVQELVAQLAAVPAGSPQAASIQSDITKLSVFNGRLVNYIADFTTLTAQYGTDIANQLVALEQWRDTEKDTLRSLISDPTQLANALATVDQIVSNGWKDIIDGTKSGVDDMKKALQGLADYLKGLFTSDVSPLKPGEQFAFEKTLFDTTFAKAQGGDIQAINDLPKIADTLLHLGGDFLSVSSEAFRELFATVTTDLGNLAGTQPNGLPVDSNAAIVSALPVNSKIASSEDIATLTAAMTELETAVADANSEDLADVKALLLRIANSLTSTTSTLRANA